ncbi:MAG: transcription-repair coupling factor [Nitrospira sp.]|nr:transcription-repair coupling factor [Nitrospira sp.]
MSPTACDQLLTPVLEALTTPGAAPFVVGAQGPSLAFTLSALMMTQQGHDKTTAALDLPFHGILPPIWLVLTPTQDEAESLFQDMTFFFASFALPADSLTCFPDRGQAPSTTGTLSIDLVAQRMQTLFRLYTHRPTVVITTPAAALQRLIPQAAFARSCIRLHTEGQVDRETLIHQLLCTGYRRVSMVDIPGEFSVRGGIIDIFSTGETAPCRIECLGDTIESMRQFDPATQESTDTVTSTDILPAREYLPPPEHEDLALADVPPDAEWYLPNMYPAMATLLDYISASPFVVMDRPVALKQVAREWWEGVLEAWEEHDRTDPSPQPSPGGRGSASLPGSNPTATSPQPSPGGSVLDAPYPDPSRCYVAWETFAQDLASCPSLACDVIAPGEDSWSPVVTLPIQSPASVGLGLRGTPFTKTLEILEQFRRKGPVMIVVHSAGQVGRLLELFGEYNAPATEQNPLHPHTPHPSPRPSPKGGGGLPAPRPGPSTLAPFSILQGMLSSGFVAPSFPFTVVTEEEVFAKIARHRSWVRRNDGGGSRTVTFLSSLDDLNPGDYVVHAQHGICRYQGLRRLAVQDCESDYLVLEFAGRDTVYVPLDRLNQIQPYRAGDHPPPPLDRLGGTGWAKTKARVARAIEDMTDELVELYADREIVTRQPYREDSMLSHEFDAAFDYDETPDQLKAIEDIRRDLELPQPMDRLVCGDVGYGKTEVAMRAAFQAVQDHRQVVVLVPTTLLAQQHYETFSRRFAPFPVRVAALSRFQSTKEVNALLPDLLSGAVDIVIGTHRLLQKNVQFKRLGLAIIDEEQWFGVRHKERLKQLRTRVDVLTLTATPIPRTLQMAFSGVRDLSVIDTPPPARLAIRTQVVRFNSTLVRDAIRRELARNGQVFYVHNRVDTIERTARWLRELVPEARLVMAHGQVSEHVLEGVMLRFLHGEADVLLATTIIQSGLDVPRANTILVDRAHTFGLAQLYQLRGRVGRAGEQAYAYFLFPNEEMLSTDAQRRLRAIEECSDLGSGFRIAAADLEIRGAGNLLGKQQSGSIAAVGFDLYMKMVKDAVQRKKGAPVEDDVDPTIHVSVSAFIPDDYVEDDHQRLSLYKRLSTSQTIGDLALLHEETRDRYGTPPEAVERLFEVMQLQLLARRLRLESLDAVNGKLTLTCVSAATLSRESLDWLRRYAQDRLQFVSSTSCTLDMPFEEWSEMVAEVTVILNGVLEAAHPTGVPSRS